MQTLTLAEFRAALAAQGVDRINYALVCPNCKTVQSIRDFVDVGLTAERAERLIGFSCVGRAFSIAKRPAKAKPGDGCDWSLGGLLKLHELEVVDDHGRPRPHFAPATPEQAQAHAARRAGEDGHGV